MQRCLHVSYTAESCINVDVFRCTYSCIFIPVTSRYTPTVYTDYTVAAHAYFTTIPPFHHAPCHLPQVGESGSGKSTVVNLIERFYDPQHGRVLLDGHDIKTLNLRWLRKQIGLVAQEPALFNTSILENIKYGNPDATLDMVEAAARVANAEEFITTLGDGY